MMSVNLIPPARRQAKRRQLRLRRWTVICAIYAGIVAGVCGVSFAVWPREQFNAHQQLRTESARLERAKRDIGQLEGQLAQVRSELAANEAVGRHPDWSILLELVGRSADARLLLRALRLETLEAGDRGGRRGRDDASATRAGYLLEIDGAGMTQAAVSRFVLSLEQAGLFDTVVLEGTRRETIHKTPAVVFDLRCNVYARGQEQP